MDAKNLLAYGLTATLSLSSIPSNSNYVYAVEYQKEAGRQVRQDLYDSKIPTNEDISPFTLLTESRLTKVETKVESLENKVESLSESFVYLTNDIKSLASELRIYIKTEVGITANKIDNLESKLDRKIENIEKKIGSLETTVNKAKWFISGAIAAVGIIASLVSYIGLDKIAKILSELVAKH